MIERSRKMFEGEDKNVVREVVDLVQCRVASRDSACSSNCLIRLDTAGAFCPSNLLSK